MPISLNMIEQRLEEAQYETMEKLESDLKRMIQNAKDYNASKSPIFEDAERIRKALSNFMPKHNPAYLQPDYRAYPTPIPQALLDRVRESSASTAGNSGPERVKLVFSKDAARRRQSEPAPASADEGMEEMKASQLELLKSLSGHEEAMYVRTIPVGWDCVAANLVGSNFEERVSKRDYPDYYRVIKRPTSISDVRSMVEKDQIKDWDTFSREMRLIWDNAKEYNQEGSDIYEMAEKLEV